MSARQIGIEKFFPWRRKEKADAILSNAKKPSKNAKEFQPPLELRRAILLWLAKQKPTGIGIKVPTRFSKYQADVAAFWSYPLKKKIYKPKKTVIIEIRRNREECWPDCSNHRELAKKILEQKELKRKLEAEIRANEPELRDNDNLFSEYESWRYKDSQNKPYHKCLKNLAKIEHSLYGGSRFEQIKKARMADNLYIAVPAGTLHGDELTDGWGLLSIGKNFSVKVEKKSEDLDCEEKNIMHLVQMISASSKNFVLFSQGINRTKNEKFFITPPPHRRKKTGKRVEI
jgi:hypothetical protein